jgi:hypothetical protein
VTAIKGSVPFVTPGYGFLAIDTSTGSQYSDYTFTQQGNLKSFRRIDMVKNFRFYLRLYYDKEMAPNTTVFSKTYSNKKTKTITATIKLDNGISRTANTQITLECK